MRGYAVYLMTRLGQFALVVFIGINIAFIVTHATPIDPVEQSIAAATQYGSTSPEAIALMRQSLKELYGLEGGLGEQYLAFWRRVAVGNFGPSLFSNVANSTANRPGRLELSDAMMKSLGAFAERGDPNAPAALGVIWPTWPSTLLFDATPTSKTISVQ